jgi:hypothetical protein
MTAPNPEVPRTEASASAGEVPGIRSSTTVPNSEVAHTEVPASAGEISGQVPEFNKHVAISLRPLTTFPFLSLPTEIQLMVYEALPITERSITMDFNGRYFMQIYAKGAPVTLLATCRKIHDEAEPIV